MLSCASFAYGAAEGDGILIYGQSGNTTPQFRVYDSVTNSLGAAQDSVAGTQANIFVIKASPTQEEMVAGYINTASTLQVMCWNGSSWSNEWSASVGSSTIQRFNIAYETNSGDVMVLYSRNTGSTNELGYRTKAGTNGCGSGNWTSENTLDATRTSGVVEWIELAYDPRASSNRIVAAWTDANRDLTARVWTGSAWEAEPPQRSKQTLTLSPRQTT